MTKISKSKFNVVDPDRMFEQYGADTVRLYMLSDAPPDKMQVWSESGIKGAWRMLNRLWDLVLANIKLVAPKDTSIPQNLDATNKALRRKTHQCIMRATEAIEGGFHFNTAIARCNELLNQLRSAENKTDPAVLREVLETVLCLIAPIVPHFSEELWEQLGHNESIFAGGWPEADSSIAAEEELIIPVQVNGKVRSRITVPAGIDNKALEEAALKAENIDKHIEGKTIRKVIVIPGKLVNIAVS
jgi:leucyl-tRNA synthetase